MGKGTTDRKMEGGESERDAECERERREGRGQSGVGSKWM